MVSEQQSSNFDQNSVVASMDVTSPYYLHRSDNPGLVLVNQQLTGDNYASWSRAIKIAISFKNKLDDGSLAKPVDKNKANLLLGLATIIW